MHRGKAERPPAGDQEEPGTDRPVETREPQIRPHASGRESVDPVAGCIRDAAGRAAHRPSAFPVSVSNALLARFLALASGTVGLVPSASLRLGPVGRGPIAAASQTCLAICSAWTCPAFICLGTSAGTPQSVIFSSTPLIILASDARNVLNSLQASCGVE